MFFFGVLFRWLLPDPFSKIPFFAGVNSKFEMQLLAIDSSYLQSLVYYFLANFILFLKQPFFTILPVEGATAPASRPCQMSYM